MIQKKIKRFICQNQIVYYLLSPVIFVRRFLINTRNKFMIGIFRKIFTKVESGYVLVRLPEFFGSFNMDVRSHIFRRIALYGEYENDVRNLVIDHLDVNRDAIDVGANVGLFSVSIAYQLSEGHKVLAIEPTSGAMTLLRKNIEQNGVFDSVIVYHGAVSDHSGLVSLNVAEGNEEYSSIGDHIVHESIKNHQTEKIKVDCSTIDALVEKYGLNPGLIKIDVEGAEFLVLFGAKNTLKNFHPVVIFESSDKLLENFSVSFKDITQIFEELNYQVIALEDKNEFIAKYRIS